MAETKLQTIRGLLAEEEAKLAAVSKPPKTSRLRRYLAPVGRAYIHSVAGFGF
jgi:hypothetical protein